MARRLALGLFASCWLAACGGGGGAGTQDLDGDGYALDDGDCDDEDRGMYPGAPEPCDGIDNNCDGVVDEGFDEDGDGHTTCSGDCQDNDAASYPNAPEQVDGLDNDCDGTPDNNTTQYDDDGDGYSEESGDCDDTNSLIGPGAIEVDLNEDGEAEGFDNDCDGEVDEGELACPTDLDPSTPMAFAAAIDICNQVREARWTAPGIDPRSRGIFGNYGQTYVPNMGETFALLATGLAGDRGHLGGSFVSPNVGTAFSNSGNHPDPQGVIGCSSEDPDTVNDISELELVIDVPANANSFSFDFNFMSGEFPEYVCTIFDDTFLALLESVEFTGNVSFDSQGNRMSINSGFFDKCVSQSSYATETANCQGDSQLVGTGHEGVVGGGTGWLTTTAPVRPGEKITLRFIIFDEGDHGWDSAVILDNFRWHVEQVEAPITVEKVVNRDLGPAAPADRR